MSRVTKHSNGYTNFRLWSKTMRQGADMVFPVTHYHQSPSDPGSEQKQDGFLSIGNEPFQ